MENITGQSSKLLDFSPHHVLEDVNTFVNETKDLLYNRWLALYQKHAPQILTEQVDKMNVLLYPGNVWLYYEKYQKPIDRLLSGLAILIVFRIVSKLYQLVKPSRPIEELQSTTKTVLTEKDYETIPLCVGKGDREELLLLNSYTEILNNSKDDDVLNKYGLGKDFSDTNSKSDMSILDGFLSSKYDSPDDFTTSDVSAIFRTGKNGDLETSFDIENVQSERESSSSSPEDSFEREENILDGKLDTLNNSSMVISQSAGSSSIDQYSTSPSKLIYKKTSISILTNNVFPKATVADTTVGDVTEETVYSETFAGDENTSFKNSL